ncbi:hypothetical protein Pan44_44650 [Caulifigura coniformis]|uniref:Uncharacterized protein n=1 Tax=Caulifigura coniformis TaxID=2527983 RepID=A0A517SJW4_9PLAN|nr:hypothetical protein [Caulifigura coniformis]QDT56411.1 hypothetical protein Pan44_44650 [Caulifigura coniformis]
MFKGLQILILATALGATGCQWASRFGAARDPFGPKSACALPPESTKDEIVAYLNRNVLAEEGQPGLRGWKSDSAKVRMHGISASATLQVEAPRNFRMRVMQPLSNTAMLDIGSNAEGFWVWDKNAPERVVLTCRHSDIAATAAHLEMPFPVQPEWLMEVFGVVPLDPNEFRMERDVQGSPLVKLISDCRGPTGEPMQRVIQVNACHGLIYLHELRNAEGVVIARASFEKHYHDPDTKLVLVKQIRIELPQDKMLLTLELDRIQVNPSSSEDSLVFSVPQLPGHHMVDLAQVARSQRGGPPQQYADASGELSAPDRAGTTPAAAAPPSEAPEWPPRETAPAGGQAPALRFEPEPEGENAEPQFQPPGGQFELPNSSAESEFRPVGESIRGQSPTASGAPKAAEKPGFWSRFKSVFTGGPESAASPPGAYSPRASRSSWGPPRLGQE